MQKERKLILLLRMSLNMCTAWKQIERLRVGERVAALAQERFTSRASVAGSQET